MTKLFSNVPCACGCGHPLTQSAFDAGWAFIRGHKPKAEAAATLATTAADASTEMVWDLTVTLSETQIDAVWATLTADQKATGLVAALERED